MAIGKTRGVFWDEVQLDDHYEVIVVSNGSIAISIKLELLQSEKKNKYRVSGGKGEMDFIPSWHSFLDIIALSSSSTTHLLFTIFIYFSAQDIPDIQRSLIVHLTSDIIMCNIARSRF